MRTRVLLALALALAACSAAATTLVPRSLRVLSREADQVFAGRVLSASASWIDGAIWTTYELEVTDWIKEGRGGAPARTSVRQLGGQVGEERMVAIGIPQFAIGEELVLFTKDYGAGWQSVHNHSQGALAVRRSRGQGGQERRLLPAAGGSFPEETALTDVDDLRMRVRRHAEARRP